MPRASSSSSSSSTKKRKSNKAASSSSSKKKRQQQQKQKKKEQKEEEAKQRQLKTNAKKVKREIVWKMLCEQYLQALNEFGWFVVVGFAYAKKKMVEDYLTSLENLLFNIETFEEQQQQAEEEEEEEVPKPKRGRRKKKKGNLPQAAGSVAAQRQKYDFDYMKQIIPHLIEHIKNDYNTMPPARQKLSVTNILPVKKALATAVVGGEGEGDLASVKSLRKINAWYDKVLRDFATQVVIATAYDQFWITTKYMRQLPILLQTMKARYAKEEEQQGKAGGEGGGGASELRDLAIDIQTLEWLIQHLKDDYLQQEEDEDAKEEEKKGTKAEEGEKQETVTAVT